MTTVDTPWKRVVTPGTFQADWWHDGQRDIKLFVEIEYRFEMNKKWELSICGTEGPKTNGDAVGGSGQIRIPEREMHTYAPGWDRGMLDRLVEIWDRWHLNGMRAGSPAQQAWLRDHPVTVNYPESHYVKASAALAAAGLNPDPNFFHPTKSRDRVIVTGGYGVDARIERIPTFDVPYLYGHAWIYEEVPADVLDWLYHLPTAEWPHPWGDRDQLLEVPA